MNTSVKTRKKAFFIDDDSDFLKLIPNTVRHPHFEVLTYHAANGYRIIDEVIKMKPDVLFIDFYLPRANGSQILPILKSVEGLRELPVYFITGFSKDEIKPFLEDSNYEGILLKSGASLRTDILKILDQVDRILPPNSSFGAPANS